MKILEGNALPSVNMFTCLKRASELCPGLIVVITSPMLNDVPVRVLSSCCVHKLLYGWLLRWLCCTFFLLFCLFPPGLLQSSGQRQAAQAARDCQGQVLQPTGRGEDQGSGRSLCADGIVLLSTCFCKNKLFKWEGFVSVFYACDKWMLRHYLFIYLALTSL